MQSGIPRPTIYLRDKFQIKPGLAGRFFDGQKALLENLKPLGAELIAACGTAPLILEGKVPENLPSMMHIWRLHDWGSLYQAMYRFSETDWYAREVSSLRIEHQDLLIRTGHGIDTSDRPRWLDKDTPDYIYVYDEIRVNDSTTKLGYLRDLNWFIAQVSEKPFSWQLAWIAAEITGTPSQVCLLWRVPKVENVETALTAITYSDNPYIKDRYAKMMLGVEVISRTYMYPESTEYIDQTTNPGYWQYRNALTAATKAERLGLPQSPELRKKLADSITTLKNAGTDYQGFKDAD